jgi:hypothetical protein
VITSAVFHSGEVGVAYAPVTLAAKGGVPPYSWSISVGSLPVGLSVSTGGSVSGTPAASVTAFFTVHVADTVGGSAIVNRSIAVAKALSISGMCTTATPCAVEEGCTICGKFALQSGGVGPFAYSRVGSLPPGMGMSGLALTGPFPPPPVGIALPPPYRFQVTVKDSLGAAAVVTAQFSVFAHIKLPDINAGQQPGGVPLTFSMPYSGGSGIPTAALLKDALPKGSTWRIDTAKRVILVSVPAQVRGRLPVLYTATFGLTDQALCGPSAGQRCSTTGTLTFSV